MMQTGRTVGSQVDRALELLVVWVLAVSALGLVAALAGCFLAPQVCLAAFLLTGLYVRRANREFDPLVKALRDGESE